MASGNKTALYTLVLYIPLLVRVIAGVFYYCLRRQYPRPFIFLTLNNPGALIVS